MLYINCDSYAVCDGNFRSPGIIIICATKNENKKTAPYEEWGPVL